MMLFSTVVKGMNIGKAEYGVHSLTRDQGLKNGTVAVTVDSHIC